MDAKERAKDKFREGWVRIRQALQFGESNEIIQPFSLMYAYFYKEKTMKVLRPEHQNRIDTLQKALEGDNSLLFSGLSVEDRRQVFEKEVDFQKRTMETINFIETTDSFKEEKVTDTLVETYITGKDSRIISMRLRRHEYEPCSEDIVIEAAMGSDWMVKYVDETYFNIKEIKARVHYLRTRGISKERAKKMVSSNAKDAIWYKPKEGILYNFCRSHHIIYNDPDYVEGFDEAMRNLPLKKSDKLCLPLT